MISLLLILAASAYAVQLIVLLSGITKADRAATNQEYEPTVSVIIAARNEEQGIASCLHSIARLEYPRSKLQVIIVNDGSTDSTSRIVSDFIDERPGMAMISATPGTGNLRGKTNAVAQGIAHATGEILMYTDADCTVPKTWVRETVAYFQDSIGVVGGFTLLDSRNVFGGMQALDWIYLFGLASSSAGWKAPLTVIGNNLSIRRAAYTATGGYENIP